MPFFSQFPKIEYDFNRTGTIQQMVNIFRSVRTQGQLDNATLYKNYTVKNGARPDIVSQELYGTPDFYWTFFIINDFLHDGLQTWPMSEAVLEKYIEKNYSGVAICFQPILEADADGISQGTANSVAGILELGELIYGSTSGAVGRLVRKDADLNQIVLQDVVNGTAGIEPKTGASNTNIVGGGFRGTNNGSGTFDGNHREYLSASVTTLDSSTLFSLQTFEVYPYAEAPCYYYEVNDASRRPLTSNKVIPTSPVYSDLQWDESLQFNTSYTGNDDLTSGRIITNSSALAPLIPVGGYKQEYQQYGDSPVDPDSGEVTTFSANAFTYISNRQKIRERNEERSQIKVIDPNYINQFVTEFEELINA